MVNIHLYGQLRQWFNPLTTLFFRLPSVVRPVVIWAGRKRNWRCSRLSPAARSETTKASATVCTDRPKRNSNWPSRGPVFASPARMVFQASFALLNEKASRGGLENCPPPRFCYGCCSCSASRLRTCLRLRQSPGNNRIGAAMKTEEDAAMKMPKTIGRPVTSLGSGGPQ